jgi:uroporphyrinogen decarboxylase
MKQQKVKQMTTSKELVKQAIEFRHPERVPYNFDSNRTPVIAEKYGEDFVWLFAKKDPDFKPRYNEPKKWETEWGIVYESLNTSHGEPKEFPLADLTKIADFQVPDFTKSVRYLEAEQLIKDNPDKYLMGMFPHFLFQVMIELIGFETFMMSPYDNREMLDLLADKLTESCLKVVDCFADRGVDGIIAIEDLGLQSSMMFHPDLWREIYKPRMAKIVKRCHDRGLHFLIHTCGGIMDVIEDYIEVGTDVLNIDQQDNLGIDELSRRYKGRICFFCPVDIQTTLPVGTLEQIEAKVKHLIKALGTDAGGFMAKTYPQPDSIAIPEASTKFMCECFKKYGKYPLSF